MKLRILFTLALSLTIASQLFAQFDTHVINHGGLDRTYYSYVPDNYDPSIPASVVVYLHGMGDISVADVQNLYDPHQFLPIADTANFILLVPVAEVFNMLVVTMRAWNSQAGVDIPLVGSISPNADVDDFGFIDAMLDETIANYSVNEGKMYVCGFSMGGFMTERFALQHNHRFAAFASVGGTIGANIESTEPGRPIRLAHFHGTADGTVGFTNNTFGWDAEETRDFWIEHNNCDEEPIETGTYTDYTSGGAPIEVDYYAYSNGDADVEFHVLNDAEHVWLQKNSTYIWKFFNQYEGVLSVDKEELSKGNVSIYPNPVENLVNISLTDVNINEAYQIQVVDMNGKVIEQTKSSNLLTQVNLESINSGVYFVKLFNKDFYYTHKLIVQ